MDTATLRMVYPSATDADIEQIVQIYAAMEPLKSIVASADHLPEQTKAGIIQSVASTAQNVVVAVVLSRPRA